MLPLLIASQLAAPQPIRIEDWYFGLDYPTSEMEKSETAFRTVTQTLIDAHGKIVGCRIETPSRNAEIDARACAIILKRGKFEPARWSDGANVPGIYRAGVVFMLYGDSVKPFGDIELEVARLPKGQKPPVSVTIAFASDADGHVVDCAEQPPLTKRSKPHSPMLIAIACQTIKAEWKPFTVLGEDGRKSRSVQNATVLFSLPEKP